MMCEQELRLRLDALQIARSGQWAASGLALCLAAWVFWPGHFFAPYLVGYLFWLGIALGSIGLTMLHHLVGGSWGLVIRRPLEAGAATVPRSGGAFSADRIRHSQLFIPGHGPDRAESTERGAQGRLPERAIILAARSRLLRRVDGARVCACGWSSPPGPHERPSPQPATAATERPGHGDPVCGEHASRRSTG